MLKIYVFNVNIHCLNFSLFKLSLLVYLKTKKLKTTNEQICPISLKNEY